MSEEKKTTISLSSMREKRQEKNDEKKLESTKTETPIEETSTNKATNIKNESVDSINTSQPNDEKIKISLSNKKVELELDKEDLTEVKTEKNDETTLVDTKIENTKTENSKEDKKQNTKNEEEIIFSNYTSDFTGKEKNIITKLKKLKEIPKTNPVFLGVIITLTIFGVAGLVLINPDKFFDKSVKTSILDSKDSDKEVVEKIEPTIELPIIWERELLQRNGYNIEVESRIAPNGTKIFKYNNVELESIDQIDGLFKQNKVKNFLLQRNTREEKNDIPQEEVIKRNKNTALELLKSRKN